MAFIAEKIPPCPIQSVIQHIKASHFETWEQCKLFAHKDCRYKSHLFLFRQIAMLSPMSNTSRSSKYNEQDKWKWSLKSDILILSDGWFHINVSTMYLISRCSFHHLLFPPKIGLACCTRFGGFKTYYNCKWSDVWRCPPKYVNPRICLET